MAPLEVMIPLPRSMVVAALLLLLCVAQAAAYSTCAGSDGSGGSTPALTCLCNDAGTELIRCGVWNTANFDHTDPVCMSAAGCLGGTAADGGGGDRGAYGVHRCACACAPAVAAVTWRAGGVHAVGRGGWCCLAPRTALLFHEADILRCSLHHGVPGHRIPHRTPARAWHMPRRVAGLVQRRVTQMP